MQSKLEANILMNDRIEDFKASKSHNKPKLGRTIHLSPQKTKIVNCAKCVGECKIF